MRLLLIFKSYGFNICRVQSTKDIVTREFVKAFLVPQAVLAHGERGARASVAPPYRGGYREVKTTTQQAAEVKPKSSRWGVSELQTTGPARRLPLCTSLTGQRRTHLHTLSMPALHRLPPHG